MNHFNHTWPILMAVSVLCFGACSDNNTAQKETDASKDMKMVDMSSDLQVDPDMNNPEDMGKDQDTTITPETSSVVGRAVKGPFLSGSVVTVYELNVEGEREGRTIIGTTNDFGEFLVKPLGFDGWVEVEVKGNYFDELTKQPSAAPTTLSVLAESKNGKVIGNINLFTQFTLKRVRNLIETKFEDTIKDARRTARADFARIFFVANHTERLSILNRGTRGIERDNTILLWFSASVLKSGTTDANLEILADDFADDGRINDAGVDVFDAIKKQANTELYIEARSNLLAKYADVPPLFTKDDPTAYIWLYNNCFVPNEPEHEKLCVGANKSLKTTLKSKTWTDFSFIAPYSGAFTVSANFADFNNFNQWKLLEGEGQVLAQGDGRNTWKAVSLSLKAGTTYTFSAYSSVSEDTNTVDIDIQSASDGQKAYPKPLMDDVLYEGWVGFHGGLENASWNSYYIYYADDFFGKDSVSIFVNDVGEDVEVSVYKATATDIVDQIFGTTDALIETVQGRQSVQVDVKLESEVLLIKVTNKSDQTSPQTQVPGRLPYRISVY